MVNESKNMYIPEDTLENHQGTWWLFLPISGKHLSTLHERGTGVVGGRGDLKMGMGKEEVGEDVREGRRVNSPHFQQLDRCSTLSSTFPPSAA